MTDISTTTTTPGIKGATRSTWRDENHLRGLLLKLIRQNPDASRDELEELYLAAAKGPKFRAKPQCEELIDEALRRSFDNDYARVQQPARPQRRNAAAAVDAADQRLKSIVLLDLIQPNGRKLRDCTGKECAQTGGWLTQVAQRVGDKGVVGEVLSEKQLSEILMKSPAK